MIDVVDRFSHSLRIVNMALIKDLRNLMDQALGIEILDVAGGALASEIPSSKVGVTSSSS